MFLGRVLPEFCIAYTTIESRHKARPRCCCPPQGPSLTSMRIAPGLPSAAPPLLSPPRTSRRSSRRHPFPRHSAGPQPLLSLAVASKSLGRSPESIPEPHVAKRVKLSFRVVAVRRAGDDASDPSSHSLKARWKFGFYTPRRCSKVNPQTMQWGSILVTKRNIQPGNTWLQESEQSIKPLGSTENIPDDMKRALRFRTAGVPLAPPSIAVQSQPFFLACSSPFMLPCPEKKKRRLDTCRMSFPTNAAASSALLAASFRRTRRRPMKPRTTLWISAELRWSEQQKR